MLCEDIQESCNIKDARLFFAIILYDSPLEMTIRFRHLSVQCILQIMLDAKVLYFLRSLTK